MLGANRKQSSLTLAADVVEVYQENFFEEIDHISMLAQQYNYISMVSDVQLNLRLIPFKDTEFPGDVFDGST